MPKPEYQFIVEDIVSDSDTLGYKRVLVTARNPRDESVTLGFQAASHPRVGEILYVSVRVGSDNSGDTE